MDETAGFLLRHLPAVATTVLVAVLGVIFDERIFTKAKAKAEGGRGPTSVIRDWLPFMLIIGGASAGLWFPDPYGYGWNIPRSVAFYATCSACAYPVWIVARRRYHFYLPGDDNPGGTNGD